MKQGNPLSPFLFTLTLDPLLNSLNSSSSGVHLPQSCIAAMAYADDLVLMASPYSELIRNLVVAQRHFKNTGLQLNKKKPQYFGWKYDAHSAKWFDYSIPPLRLGGVVIEPKR